MSKSLSARFIRSVPWTIADALFNAVYGVVMVLLIGRFIEPGELGVAVTAFALVQLVEGISALGMQEAVIRARSGHTQVTDTAYTMAVVASLVAVLLCAAVSWPMAWAFGNDRLSGLVCLAALVLPLNALAAVPTAMLSRKLRASALTRRLIAGKLMALTTLAVGGVFDLGAWCVVLSSVASSLGGAVAVGIATHRWPRLRYDVAIARELARFGITVAMESLAWLFTGRAFIMLFGYAHGMTNLGHFQFAQRLVDEVAALLQSSITRMGLAYFSGLERLGGQLRASYLAGTRLLNVVAAPVYAGLALVAADLIPMVFGDRWLPAVPFIWILALAWLLSFSRILVPAVIKAKGRPDILLRFGLFRAALVLSLCALTAHSATLWGGVSWAAGLIVGVPWAMAVARRHLGVPLADQLAELAPPLLMTAIMAVAVVGVQWRLSDDGALRVVLPVVVGMVTYCALILAFDRKTLALIRGGAQRFRGA